MVIPRWNLRVCYQASLAPNPNLRVGITNQDMKLKGPNNSEEFSSINLHFRDQPLLKMKNITLTPHVGSASHQARRQIMKNSVESILAALSGPAIPNEVLLKWFMWADMSWDENMTLNGNKHFVYCNIVIYKKYLVIQMTKISFTPTFPPDPTPLRREEGWRLN